MDESKGRAKGRAIGGCIGALEDPGVEQRSDGIKVSDVMADEGNVEYKKFAALHAGVTETGRLSMHVHVMATTAAEKDAIGYLEDFMDQHCPALPWINISTALPDKSVRWTWILMGQSAADGCELWPQMMKETSGELLQRSGARLWRLKHNEMKLIMFHCARLMQGLNRDQQ